MQNYNLKIYSISRFWPQKRGKTPGSDVRAKPSLSASRELYPSEILSPPIGGSVSFRFPWQLSASVSNALCVNADSLKICPLETKGVKISTSQYQGEVRTLSEGENFPPINWREEISPTFRGQSFGTFSAEST